MELWCKRDPVCESVQAVRKWSRVQLCADAWRWCATARTGVAPGGCGLLRPEAQLSHGVRADGETDGGGERRCQLRGVLLGPPPPPVGTPSRMLYVDRAPTRPRARAPVPTPPRPTRPPPYVARGSSTDGRPSQPLESALQRRRAPRPCHPSAAHPRGLFRLSCSHLWETPLTSSIMDTPASMPSSFAFPPHRHRSPWRIPP